MSYSDIAWVAEPRSAEGVPSLPAYLVVAASNASVSKPLVIASEPVAPHSAPPLSSCATPGSPVPAGFRAPSAALALQQPSAASEQAIASSLRMWVLQSLT